MSNLTVVKNCKVHGELTEGQCYYRKNRNIYECRECMRESEKKRPKREYSGAFAEYHRAHAKEWRRQNADQLNAKIREDRKNNPEKYREWERKQRYKNIEKSRYLDVLNKHGITSEQYQQIYEKHQGLCFVCQKEETRLSRNGITTTRLSLDHCHLCESRGYKGMDVIRGILCASCNKAISAFEENPEWFVRIQQYLQSHEHKDAE